MPPASVGERRKYSFEVPPVVKLNGREVGSTLKTTCWPEYEAPGVPMQVPFVPKLNDGLSGAVRSPCSFATRRMFIGTHSATAPIATFTVSVSWEPESVAPVIESVS